MDRAIQLKIFNAQTANVRELQKAWKHLNRAINHDLKNDQIESAKLKTKLLALVFSAWSEANFLKLIHTPYGFEINEIEQIKEIAKSDIVAGWKKCLELGLRKISNRGRSNYIPNIRREVEKIIDKYIKRPRLLRNKIAHGQWVEALNARNDNTNPDISSQIASLDVVTLMKWKLAYEQLSKIIELLIESPDKAFHRDYWECVDSIKSKIEKCEQWSLEEKIKKLKLKKSYTQI